MEVILEIKKSRNGNGIFTKNQLKNNEPIFQIKGKLITTDTDHSSPETVKNNTIRFSKKYFLSPRGETGDYLNHSCEPNAKISKIGEKLFIIAIRDIGNGEEVLIDYSTLIASDDDWKMSCSCGSKKCRGNIGKFSELSTELVSRYTDENITPDYILEIK